MVFSLEQIQEKIGYTFSDVSLLESALTHCSVDLKSAQQRLEYLGDAIIQLIISEFLFQEFPEASEGELTQRRAVLVSQSGLKDLAEKISLWDFLIFREGEKEKENWRTAARLADGFEALFAAIYLDGGLEKARKSLDYLLKGELKHLTDGFLEENPKGELQKILQALSSDSIEYEVVEKRGEAHNPFFRVGVHWKEKCLGQGEGRNIKEAEKEAASEALKNSLWEI